MEVGVASYTSGRPMGGSPDRGRGGPPRSNLHVEFAPIGEVKERKEKYLTAKYGAHQMSLIRKRLNVEMWMFDQLQSLYPAPLRKDLGMKGLSGIIKCSHRPLRRFMLPLRNTSFSKFLAVRLHRFGLMTSEPILNSRSTAAEEGTGVLYLMNRSTQICLCSMGNMWKQEGKYEEKELDLDELLDVDGELKKRKYLWEALADCKQSKDKVEKFINEVLERATTLIPGGTAGTLMGRLDMFPATEDTQAPLSARLKVQMPDCRPEGQLSYASGSVC
ncbi:hypothetical protein GWK47_018330 [Chionoecetes opilio]|uniref:Protein phosphatase 1 regulatory subunit 14B n=1 Tax=Chionoecetes opilio TaxID=41210 RepID=A0A8J4XQJ2_CHIOP|nr:hypothetical protein GWK47_018330 [Chionoecetes opilio]